MNGFPQIRKIMKESDKRLLKTYMNGFNDELESKFINIYSDFLFRNAYELGKQDAIIGDDISSFDNQSNEEILKRIKRNKL